MLNWLNFKEYFRNIMLEQDDGNVDNMINKVHELVLTEIPEISIFGAQILFGFIKDGFLKFSQIKN